MSHGGPHSATGYSFDFKKQYFAANGYFVLDTNFRSSTGYGEKFKWATWGAWGDKDGEQHDERFHCRVTRHSTPVPGCGFAPSLPSRKTPKSTM